MTKKNTGQSFVDELSMKFTSIMGSPLSIAAHTVFFIAIFGLAFFGFSIDQIMLILTTAVSLEAIYLSLFIQMTVNRNTASLTEVEKDIDEIEEDVENISEDVENISEDIEEIQESDAQEEAEENKEEIKLQSMLIKISEELSTLTTSLSHVKSEIEELKAKHH